jgi:hypothetical protein
MSVAVLAVITAGGLAHAQQTLFSENFDGLAGSLGPSVNERIGLSVVTTVATDPGSSPISNAFSKTGPAGWSIDNNFDAYGASIGNVGVPELGNPDYGVDEWEGWSFANKDFWVRVAGDQNRGLFAKASGNVAVADSDEWDDLKVNPTTIQGWMNTNLITGNINVAAHGGQTLNLKFDSSWRDEAFDDDHGNAAFNGQNNQSVVIAASFDGASEVFFTNGGLWNSDSNSPFFKDDNENETVNIPVDVPAGATNVQLKFGYYNAANDWWWAIDNLELTDAGMNSVWSENFDAVTLGDSVNERETQGKVTVAANTPNTIPWTDPVTQTQDAFTHTPPAGWNIENNLPGIGDPDVGVEEWEGWSFAKPSFWTFADTQGRQNFTNGTGVIAVVDPDEWDDLGNPEGQGTYNSKLETPEISLANVVPGTLSLMFDSSWDDEDTQTAIVEVDYGSGYVEVLRWESDPNSPNFHDTNYNEMVSVMLNNPAGAATARVRFSMENATDDWWWAVDNITIKGVVPEPATGALVSLAMIGLGLFGARRRPGK